MKSRLQASALRALVQDSSREILAEALRPKARFSPSRIQPGNFLREQRGAWILVAQTREQLPRVVLIMFAEISNRKQNVGERREIASTISCHLQFFYALLLVAGNPAQAHQPAHGRIHAANNVLAETAGHVSVVEIVVYRQGLRRPVVGLLGIPQRTKLLVVDQRRVVI